MPLNKPKLTPLSFKNGDRVRLKSSVDFANLQKHGINIMNVVGEVYGRDAIHVWVDFGKAGVYAIDPNDLLIVSKGELQFYIEENLDVAE